MIGIFLRWLDRIRERSLILFIFSILSMFLLVVFTVGILNEAHQSRKVYSSDGFAINDTSVRGYKKMDIPQATVDYFGNLKHKTVAFFIGETRARYSDIERRTYRAIPKDERDTIEIDRVKVRENEKDTCITPEGYFNYRLCEFNGYDVSEHTVLYAEFIYHGDVDMSFDAILQDTDSYNQMLYHHLDDIIKDEDVDIVVIDWLLSSDLREKYRMVSEGLVGVTRQLSRTTVERENGELNDVMATDYNELEDKE